MSSICTEKTAPFVEHSEKPNITFDHIASLIKYFGEHTYSNTSEDPTARSILQTCTELLKCDYSLIVIENRDISLNYPSRIPILQYEKNYGKIVTVNPPIYENVLDETELYEKMQSAKVARCRCRVPVPVIMYKGKYICRSSTLSGGLEIYGRRFIECGMKTLELGKKSIEYHLESGLRAYEYYLYGTDSADYTDEDVETEPEQSVLTEIASMTDHQLFSELRQNDIVLLNELNIGTIVDLMVENKKSKYGIQVTSSEKIDKHDRYKDFNLISVPYPGCEFFFQFTSHSHDAKNLHYNWGEAFNNAKINIVNNSQTEELNIEWNDYTKWDLVDLTSNYMIYLLKYFIGSNSGMLIHCISGWDRTPLFISMIRLCLWADGLIHTDLNEHEILYLTVGYDWFCFGHHLSNRLSKNEDVFLFCFYMLKYLAEPRFALPSSRSRLAAKQTHQNKLSLLVIPNSVEDDYDGTHSLDNSLEADILDTLGNNDAVKALSNIDALFPKEDNGNPSRNLTTPSSSPVSSPATSPSGTHHSRVRTSPVSIPPSKKRSDSESSSHSFADIAITGSYPPMDGIHELTSCMDEEAAASAAQRSERLRKVREIFYRCYFSTVGNSNITYGAMQRTSSFSVMLGLDNS